MLATVKDTGSVSGFIVVEWKEEALYGLVGLGFGRRLEGRGRGAGWEGGGGGVGVAEELAVVEAWVGAAGVCVVVVDFDRRW